MALSIMFYHLYFWIYSPLDSSSPLGRLGVYGVSIFFILSGLSMAIVYHSFINSYKSAVSFFTRRIFRIWPLLWIVCILTLWPDFQGFDKFNHYKFIINITTLFGFIEPASYIATGAWSIGNEMLYYALSPLVFALYNKRKWIGNIFFASTVLIGIYFAFNLLDPYKNIANQWTIYVNPFNNFFLYVMGIAIYYNFKDIRINSKINTLILISAIALFCFLPYTGNQISIVSGIGRLIFVTISFLIVFCFYKMRIKLPNIFSKPLEIFGIATYGVYLLHPVACIYITLLFNKMNIKSDIALYLSVIILTIVTAIISYNKFELKFIKLGKKLTTKH